MLPRSFFRASINNFRRNDNLIRNRRYSSVNGNNGPIVNGNGNQPFGAKEILNFGKRAAPAVAAVGSVVAILGGSVNYVVESKVAPISKELSFVSRQQEQIKVEVKEMKEEMKVEVKEIKMEVRDLRELSIITAVKVGALPEKFLDRYKEKEQVAPPPPEKIKQESNTPPSP